MTTLGAPITIGSMQSGTCWQLIGSTNGYGDAKSDELVTQVANGRSFQLITTFSHGSLQSTHLTRIEVRLLEDGYKCWIDLSEIIDRAFSRGPWNPNLLNRELIQERIPQVLKWIEQASNQKNQYLWGGTVGPNFDCSGLVQSAFASQGIWLPRDAYQQERFCANLQISNLNIQNLLPGDLLFFGTRQKCTHVALYKGQGMYWHSSGKNNGRNGIGCDGLPMIHKNPVACYYRSQLRGAGRVLHCHDGETLP